MPASGATLPCVRFRRRGRAGGTHVGRLASWSQKARPAGAQRVRACAEAAQCPRACAAPPLPARRLRWRWDFGYLSLPCRGIAAPQPYPDRGGRTAARLVEGADHVLAGRVVDARLAADGRVHGRHHGRRHLRGARLRVASRLPPARCTKSSGCAGAPERRRQCGSTQAVMLCGGTRQPFTLTRMTHRRAPTTGGGVNAGSSTTQARPRKVTARPVDLA